jgi:hypothetical protein
MFLIKEPATHDEQSNIYTHKNIFFIFFHTNKKMS